tara:strand:+ start:1404 stop:2219 length:816 start_codon:yes stop_codon:yes gene_type:complete
MFYKIRYTALIFLLSIPNAFSKQTIFIGEFVQGGIIIGQNKTAKKVLLNNKELQISKQGYFIFGFGRNQKQNSTLKVIQKNNTEYTHNLKIAKSIYKVEKIDGLPPKMVQPGPEFYKKIKEDRALIKNSMLNSYTNPEFPLNFIKPTEGRTSGVYGSQRILNGVKKNPHGGMDIAAPIGTEIKAMAAGKVLLSTKGLYYTGNIVIIGHGFNLKSMYIHMHDINVKEGDIVKQGDIIGTVGMTGRATGPHLHWNVYWNNIKVNPELLLSLSK